MAFKMYQKYNVRTFLQNATQKPNLCYINKKVEITLDKIW